MGPNSGMSHMHFADIRLAHENCQQKKACKGPGCRVRSGKTYIGRLKGLKGTAEKFRTVYADY